MNEGHPLLLHSLTLSCLSLKVMVPCYKVSMGAVHITVQAKMETCGCALCGCLFVMLY